MPLSESKKKANEKYDKNNMKYQTVKLTIKEYELLEKYVKQNELKKNNFIRKAIAYAIEHNIM